MLVLYDLNKTKIAGLKNYKDLRIERDLSGDEVLFFSYPQIDSKHDSIKEEIYIRTKKNEYVIKEINIKDDWTEFIGKVNVEDLKGTVLDKFEVLEQQCADTVNLALVSTGWSIGSCDVSKKRTVRKANCSVYDVLLEIKKIYLCDFKFDAINKKIYIYQSMGSDKGSYFSDKLNLKKLDIQSNSYDFCTRIIPIGKDGLKINNINSGKEYVENYQYSNKVITVFWEDNRYTVVENLKEDAAAKLNELSKPIRAYSAEIFDLANLNDKYKNILDYDLGDTITLLSKDKKVKEKQRIVKIIEYPDEPERNSCEIANRTLSFEDIQADTLEAAETINSVTTSDGMIDNSKVDFNPLRLEVVSLVAQKADIGELNAAVARIGTLEATTATISQLNAAVARIGVLEAGSATVTQLNAANAKIATLETRAASIDTLLAGNLTADNMKANLITAGTTLIADGSIASAKIISLSADKINAGKINTNLVSIQSSSGNMLISDNTIQIKDSTRVRVQIGKDALNDYNMYVWDSSGNLMFDAAGLKASGIKSKIIRDDMVSDTANINATKIEKESLVTRINGATTLLLASKVKLDTENQTLEVAFNSLKSTVTSTANTVTSQGTSISTIQGQIQAKIWQQDINTLEDSLDTRISSTETSITALNNAISLKVSTSDFTTYQSTVTSSLNSKANQSALNTTNGNVSSLTTRVSTAESSISVLQNQISLKVEQSDITTAINNVSTMTKLNGVELLNQTYVSNTAAKPFTYGSYTIVPASELGLTDNKNLIKCTNSQMLRSEFIPFVSGKPYYINLAAYNLETTNGILYVGVEYYDKNKVSLGSNDLSIYAFSKTTTDLPANTWKTFEGYVNTDSSRNIAGYVRLRILTRWSSLTGVTYLKDISVRQLGAYINSEVETRVSTAESTITQLSNSIALKVETSTYNSKMSSLDGSINSLSSRVSAAELKITDSSIVSTVRSSTAYTNDLAAKANQSSLTITNTNVSNLTTRVTSTESSITQLSNQISLKVNQGDFGTLITQNVNSVQIAVGQFISGQSVNIATDGGFEAGTIKPKGSVWITTYPYQGRQNGGISIDSDWNGFYFLNNTPVKPNTTYTVIAYVSNNWGGAGSINLFGTGYGAGGVGYKNIITGDNSYKKYVWYVNFGNNTNATMSFEAYSFGAPSGSFILIDNIACYEGSNLNYEWSPNPNEIGNVSVDISNVGLTVRNGAISILNNAGSQVLSGDPSGNLTIRGDFTTYDDSTGNMAMRLSKRTMYFYDYDSNAVCGEMFAGKIVGNGSQRGMVLGAWRNKFLQLSYQGTDNNMYPLVTVDNGALGNTGTISITSGKQINTQNLYVSGSKNCIQDTTNYGKRLLYAYETTENYLGDFVHGKINENGECVISIDEIFGECVNTEIQYHVFTQTYKGSITEIELYPNYFIVKGEAGTFFSCEIKAKRKGFEHVRLEGKFVEEHGVESIEDELKSLVSTDIEEELYNDLSDELLEV